MDNIENNQLSKNGELVSSYEKLLVIRNNYINELRKLALMVNNNADNCNIESLKKELDDLFDKLSFQIHMLQKGNFNIKKKIKRPTFRIVE